MYSGWVYDASLDTYPVEAPDGIIDENDVPMTYDVNLNGLIDFSEFEAWRADMVLLGLATEYAEPLWIFNIADLVLTDQTHHQ